MPAFALRPPAMLPYAAEREMPPQDPQRPVEKRPADALSAFRLLGSLGLVVSGGTVAGVVLGSWADRVWDAHGLGTALGVLIGLGAGLAAAVALLLREIPWKR